MALQVWNTICGRQNGIYEAIQAYHTLCET